MSKIIKGKKTGRHKETEYQSIFKGYRDDDLNNKVMDIPKIIKHDIGWELITERQESQYLRTKFSPENPQ